MVKTILLMFACGFGVVTAGMWVWTLGLFLTGYGIYEPTLWIVLAELVLASLFTVVCIVGFIMACRIE